MSAARPMALLRHLLALLVVAITLRAAGPEQSLAPRSETGLGDGWRGLLLEEPDTGGETPATPSEALPCFDDTSWQPLSVPHNWEQGEGLTGRKHGNLHGTAWYRREFTVPTSPNYMRRRVFLFFEGVGSFAEVWVNGRLAGSHAGGLTCFTLDVTELVKPGKGANLLAVRSRHPSGIRSLPWICGGCERAYGFSEGSQPFGIHRAVRVIVTDEARIEPFGVHIWNDETATTQAATAHIRTELKNRGAITRRLVLRHTLLAPDGALAARLETPLRLAPGEAPAPLEVKLPVRGVRLWSPEDPALYRLRTELLEAHGNTLIDTLDTDFGFRVVQWPTRQPGARPTLLINGKPVFLNGTCEYQHLLAGSHAFSPSMVATRVAQIRAAGFNAFRDAHHPHDLRYNEAWDRAGMPWWTQFGAHAWFDRDDFRANFKSLLREWVRERRNSPSLILWGLQNESVIPTDFAAECMALVREMDPTSPSQRLVTTCNTGTGTDWNVPQNWTGTYGGDPAKYGEDLAQVLLVGEYGAWRSQGLFDADPTSPNAGYSEQSFAGLLGLKLRLGAANADKAVGHFQWIFSTHENPGRNAGSLGEQSADGWNPLARVGPANNKGLLTLAGEPTDAWYLYRTFSVPASSGATVLIAGASSPERFVTPGTSERVTVYSNCEEVELFDDLDGISLGRLARPADDTPFLFENVAPRTRALVAVGLIKGRVVARDTLLLPLLPAGPGLVAAQAAEPDSLGARPGMLSVFRVNCGGPALTDSRGRLWEADRDWEPGAPHGALSWASAFPEVDPALGSLGRVHTRITGTRDPALYQTFRHGLGKLAYRIALPDGEYLVDLHFAEPWYGRGDGVNASGWRRFDVAVNKLARVRNLDLFEEAGFGRALVKSLPVRVSGGLLEVNFPRCDSYTAVLCAIEVWAPKILLDGDGVPVKSALPSFLDSQSLRDEGPYRRCDTGMSLYSNGEYTVSALPGVLVAGDCLRPETPAGAAQAPSRFARPTDLYLAVPETALSSGEKPGNAPAAKPSAPAASGGFAPLPVDAALLAASGWELTPLTLRALPAVQSGQPPKKHPTAPAAVPAAPHPAAPLTFRLWMRHAPAGPAAPALAALPAGAPLFLCSTRPGAPAQALAGLSPSHSAAPPSEWSARGRLRPGSRPHGPSGPSLTRLPQELGDADWLSTPATEPSSDFNLSFTATDHIEVFVGLDARVAERLPDWLTGFTPHSGDATLGKNTLRLFRRRFNQGDRITLGANPALPDGKPAPMYCVFARLARPLQTFPINEALLPDRPRLLSFDVGVGDRYFLVPHVRATDTATARPITLRVELLDRDGGVLCDSTHTIPAGAPPGQLRVRSCTSINAGTYHARITLLAPAPDSGVTFDRLVIE